MGFERCENILGVFVLHICKKWTRLLHDRTVSSSDTIWSLATIREATMYIDRLQLTSSPPCWMTINKRILTSFIVPVIQHGRQSLCHLNL